MCGCLGILLTRLRNEQKWRGFFLRGPSDRTRRPILKNTAFGSCWQSRLVFANEFACVDEAFDLPGNEWKLER